MKAKNECFSVSSLRLNFNPKPYRQIFTNIANSDKWMIPVSHWTLG